MFYIKLFDFVIFLDLYFHFQRIFNMYYFIIFYKISCDLLPTLKSKRKTSNFIKFEANSTSHHHIFFKYLRYIPLPLYSISLSPLFKAPSCILYTSTSNDSFSDLFLKYWSTPIPRVVFLL